MEFWKVGFVGKNKKNEENVVVLFDWKELKRNFTRKLKDIPNIKERK